METEFTYTDPYELELTDSEDILSDEDENSCLSLGIAKKRKVDGVHSINKDKDPYEFYDTESEEECYEYLTEDLSDFEDEEESGGKRKRSGCGDNSVQKKRNCNVKLVDITTLQVYFCCSLMCLPSIPLEDLSMAREFYQQKNQNERSQWIIDWIMFNSRENSTKKWSIGSTDVCLKAWRLTLGIPESTYYSIQKQVAEGKLVANINGRPVGSQSAKTMTAVVWLQEFAKSYAGYMPDSMQLHLPCCLTKTSVYESMISETEEPHISLSHFLLLWRTELRHIAIPKKSRFSECSICARIKQEMEATLDKVVRHGLAEQRNKHLWQQKAEREKYYKHQMKAKQNPNKYLSIIMDSMDQAKTAIPHFARKPKAVDGVWNMKCHLLGAKIHGIGSYGFLDFFQWAHGSNMTVSVLMNILCTLKEIPEVLYLQMDNCWKENKNRYVLALLCLLVELKVFKKVKLSFLMVGHTHEDIDQLFSRFSVWLNRNNAFTVDELMKGFEGCFTPSPIAVETANVVNFSSWIGNHINPLKKHSKPHVFKITNENDRARIVFKKWSTDKDWIECTGSEQHFLKSHPTELPRKICPAFQELNRTKETLKLVEPFLNESQLNWWNRFIKEKEDEELDFSNENDETVFPLFSLAKTVLEEREKIKSNPPDIPQIVHDDEPIDPIVIGKEVTKSKEVIQLEEGSMVLCNVEKYDDDWPQVAKVTSIDGDNITVTWYKGWTGTWLECSKPVPGQRGKRMPVLEIININDIWLRNFNLSSKGKLPKHVHVAIDNFHRNN